MAKKVNLLIPIFTHVFRKLRGIKIITKKISNYQYY